MGESVSCSGRDAVFQEHEGLVHIESGEEEDQERDTAVYQ